MTLMNDGLIPAGWWQSLKLMSLSELPKTFKGSQRIDLEACSRVVFTPNPLILASFNVNSI